MKVLILSINHNEQVVLLKDEASVPEVVEKKAKVQKAISQAITNRNVDLICEESDPRHVSIAQKEAFDHDPRIPWKNIYMTSQERLEAGIWEALLYRPYDLDFIDDNNAIKIEYRVPQDDVREEFFKNEIVRLAKETDAKSVLVLCGEMHTEALKSKLDGEGRKVETDRGLSPEEHWK